MDATGSKIARIEVALRDVNQLFHTLDPSPFRERSLDEAAEAFIVSWARDLPHRAELELLVHVRGPLPDGELTEQVEMAELGVAGFSDDGHPVSDAGVMRRALQYQRITGLPLALHESRRPCRVTSSTARRSSSASSAS